MKKKKTSLHKPSKNMEKDISTIMDLMQSACDLNKYDINIFMLGIANYIAYWFLNGGSPEKFKNYLSYIQEVYEVNLDLHENNLP